MLDFLEVAWGHAGEHPFPLETLEALARLIPCDSIGYTDVDRARRVVLEYIGTDAEDGEGAADYSSTSIRCAGVTRSTATSPPSGSRTSSPAGGC